jgi:NAD(P)-dependent dehydrogenase (short-subunit alcohol dehydrogenase family)
VDVRDLRGRWALVTGAGSGIGRETAFALGRAGADLAICDLNPVGLEETAAALRARGRTVVAERVDVADREAMSRFAAAVHERVEAVDILVNNAGVAIGGGFLHTTLEDWDWIVGINVRGVVHGCHYFIPRMVARQRGGHVVIVSSAAGYVASADLAAYATTKFAVFGLAEALRDELHPHGIGVTAVCPGIINTPITGTARMRGPRATPEMRDALVAFYQRRNYGADRVAAAIMKAIAKNRAVAPVSPEAWVMYVLKRVSPRLLARINRGATERMLKAQAPRR